MAFYSTTPKLSRRYNAALDVLLALRHENDGNIREALDHYVAAANHLKPGRLRDWAQHKIRMTIKMIRESRLQS